MTADSDNEVKLCSPLSVYSSLFFHCFYTVDVKFCVWWHNISGHSEKIDFKGHSKIVYT